MNTQKTAEQVPRSIRLRLHAGFRVPAEYRDWVASEVEKPGWALRHTLTFTMLFYWPIVELFVLLLYVVGGSTYPIFEPMLGGLR